MSLLQFNEGWSSCGIEGMDHIAVDCRHRVPLNDVLKLAYPTHCQPHVWTPEAVMTDWRDWFFVVYPHNKSGRAFRQLLNSTFCTAGSSEAAFQAISKEVCAAKYSPPLADLRDRTRSSDPRRILSKWGMSFESFSEKAPLGSSFFVVDHLGRCGCCSSTTTKIREQ